MKRPELAGSRWPLALSLVLPLLLAACPPPEPSGTVSMTLEATPGAVVADGVATVSVTVSGTTADGSALTGPISLTTSRGAWQATGARSLTGSFVDGGFSAVLVTCDSKADAACAGTAQLTAQQGAVTRSASVVFRAGELDCENGLDDDGDGDIDCMDADCDGVALSHDAICQAGQWACPGGATESLCGDGVDDDCDGSVDCEDPDCQDGVCSDTGAVCDAGACVCLVAGNPGSTPGVEGAGGGDCFDGLDNDCDGEADGADVDCQGQACNVDGDRWNGTACSCVPEQTSEAACDDGFDNDCDELVDCADPDCGGATCADAAQAPNDVGLFCDAGAGACLCPGDPAGTGIEANCMVGSGDEDCDGFADCEDTVNCESQPCGPNGLVCAGGACACPGGTQETTCNDGGDNDCDGLVDCADPDCSGASCGDNGLTCSGNVCACPGGQVETQCGDGLDNDCDGLVNCADPDCDVLACQGCGDTACLCDSDTSACVVDPGTALVQLSADANRVLAEDATAVRLTAVVTNRLGVVADAQVRFDVPQGGLEEAFGSSEYTVLTDAQGRAQATWHPGTVPAKNLTATATVVEAGVDGDAGSVPIQVIGLAGIKVKSTQYGTMGVKESGYQESNILEFTVQGTDGVTTNLVIPDGVPVVLDTSDNTAGGLYLTKTLDHTVNGVVSTTARSGTVATTFAVTATATVGEVVQSVTTGSIAIIGAKATQRGFTFQCSNWNVGALLNSDLTNSNAAINVGCTVSLKDRFTNPIALATSVSFAAEAGTIDTPRPTATGGSVGTAGTSFHTFGVLPLDVTPLPDEPYWVWQDPVTHQHYVKNPRDGLVTLIAFTNGEEEFVDGNGNGVYDGGDFLFVDANQNGAWDAPETFTDANGNGAYDLGETFVDANLNTVWDAGEALGDLDGDCRYDPRAEDYQDLNADGVFQQGEAFWDRNLNGVWDAGDPFTDLNGDRVWNPGEHYLDLNGNGTHDAGETYSDLDADCAWTPEEPFEDLDGNGTWTPAEALTFDLNDNGLWDPAEPLTSDLNGNGIWDEGDTFTDENNNGVWDDEDLFVDRDGDGVWDAAEGFTDLNGDEAWTPDEPYGDLNGNGTFDAPEPFIDYDGSGSFTAGEPFTDADGDGRYTPPEVFYDFGHDRRANTGDTGEGDGLFNPGEPFEDLDGDGVRDTGDAFQDLDGDGVYERGEYFVDLAEPFLDANDDSTWQPGEFFKDVNKNGRWDGPNCRWDRNTQIWTQTRIVETGSASVAGGMDPAPMGWWASGFHAWGDGVWPEICVPQAGTASFGLQVTDQNLNLPRGGTSTTLKKLTGDVAVKFSGTGSTSAAIIDSLGIDWGLATDCRGQTCTCNSDYCTVRSYVRGFSGGATYSVYVEDSQKTDKNPPAGFSVSATYSGCPSPCTFGAAGISD